MDGHDLKFFFFFILFFVCRRFQSRERRRSARKRIIRFAMLNRMERRRRARDSYLYCPAAFALVVSHELENQSIGRRFWSITRPL